MELNQFIGRCALRIGIELTSLLALLRFHLRAGGRVALRAAVPVFASIAVAGVFQESPAEFVDALAHAAFRNPPLAGDLAPFVALALALPAWAAARLSGGVSGWLRHLPFNGTDNRRGLTLALVAGQSPLVVILAFLAVVAYSDGLAIGLPLVRWVLILVAAAIAALPVERRFALLALAIAALVLAATGSGPAMVVAAVLLLATDRVAGRLRRATSTRPRAIVSLLHWRIAWRALSTRLITAYGAGGLALAGGWLAIVNNDLAGPRADAVARFSGALAAVLCISSLASGLALRRPMWPLARSLPWSARQRVAQDALFMTVHALPLLLLVAAQSAWAAAAASAMLPLLSLLAAGHMRPGGGLNGAAQNSAALRFVLEGLLAAAVLTLLPWTAFAWLAAAIPALWFAAERERAHKVTRWSDLHHDHAADSVARSGG